MAFKHFLLASLFSALAAADFMIYAHTDVSSDLTSGSSDSADGYLFFNGEPSCRDVCNAIFIPDVDDASGSRVGVRCKGCDSGHITEFEHNNRGRHHWTLYESGGYQITPADGGPLQGRCRRDSGDDYSNCSCGLADAESGQRLFICTSPMNAQDQQ
ncbi:MAG: hypothetical protein M1816_000579 [Peltula sp. TS41687]|nr:MAG: hypothetical protein M1816_000579 [Peltula sp. TS41687]